MEFPAIYCNYLSFKLIFIYLLTNVCYNNRVHLVEIWGLVSGTVDNRVLIIGAKGHAKVIMDILMSNGYEISGLIDDFSVHETMNQRVIGTMRDLKTLYDRKVAEKAFVAVGDNDSRKRLTSDVLEAGFELVNAISNFSCVSKWAQIGIGVAVMPGAIINADACIGNGVIINTGATVDHDCIVGDFAHAAPGTILTGKVEIGEGTFLGAGTKVIPRIHIGKWVIAGAGSLIVRDIPDGLKIAGAPAKSLLQKEL